MAAILVSLLEGLSAPAVSKRLPLGFLNTAVVLQPRANAQTGLAEHLGLDGDVGIRNVCRLKLSIPL
jgi:hypothetical protein